ncbi:hypothetical protein CDL15_Pgr015244 [Punica granatum]|uniref:Reticulon domain-containing protein n=1 Tax=Punica granatum TaxID=22663 RepID=A0A218VZX6_PUNGR|nr:hypothetical protein CDL15_Pgr015244 [Punica granatum]
MDAYSRRSSSSTAAATRSPGGVNSNKPTGSCSVVAAGSVWETRMRSDEVKGGIKVFNGGEPEADHNNQNNAVPGSNAGSPMPKGTDKRTAGPLINNGGGKRKNWKSDQSSGDGPTAPISRSRSDQLSVNEKGPAVQANKGKKEVAKKSPIQGRKLRSETARTLPELRKVKSESGKGKVGDGDGDGDGDGGGGNSTSGSAQLRKAKSQPENFEYEAAEKGEVESGSDGVCKELEVCEDKVITSSLDQEDPELPRKQSTEIDEEEYTEDEEEEENEDEEKEEEENKIMGEEIEDDSSEVIKEITMAEPCQEPENAATVAEQRKESVDIEQPKPILSANAMKKLEIKEKQKAIVISTNVNRRAPRPAAAAPPPPPTEAIKHTTTTSNSNSNRVHKNIASPTPSKPVITNVHRTSTVHQDYAKPTASYEHERFPETQNELRNLVDLVMWRDVSRSAFVFGIGTFAIISSSYTRDINISFITVISYMGLVYLAAIFLYRSIICRGYVDMRKTGNVVGEEEAVWLLKLVLPYLNEFLLKVRALFSGDPATTMKLAVLLFVTARCGSSITIWKMAKLGKFWVRRFRDAWDSCSHKKAVAFSIFTLVWNLSSVVARIWAAFMLFVAFRYYQQSLVQPDDWEKDDGGAEATWHGRAGGPRRGRGPTIVEPTKEKKASEV